MERKILLQKIGQIDKVSIEKLRKNLEMTFKKFNLTVEIIPNQLPLIKSEYNVNRNQYDAEKVKNRLKEHLMEQNYYRILGIIDKDIFCGTYSFVFGLADINWNKKITLFALISLTRLKENFYNRVENHVLYESRILKVAIHELGHTFGINHCSKVCVMQFSNQIKEMDKKTHTFCENCLVKLSTFFK